MMPKTETSRDDASEEWLTGKKTLPLRENGEEEALHTVSFLP